MDGPKFQIQEELLLAKQSRLEGNEGRARVCARRAAGAAVKGYFEKAGIPHQGENAIQAMLLLRQSGDLPARVLKALDLLIQRVNEDYNLPANVDLIQEAGIVINFFDVDG